MTALKEAGVDYEKIDYYEHPLTASKLKQLLKKMNLHPRDLLREREPMYRRLHLDQKKDQMTEEELIALMIAHPDLMQRPIVERGRRAVLARPLENIKELL